MASNQTANYGLSQWEATDQVVRADFNTDNAKIDAGMAENKAAAAAAKETAENLAAVAFTPENLPFVVGTYTGNGAASRTISLGFTPSAVYVANNNGVTTDLGTSKWVYYGGLALPEQAVVCGAGTVLCIIEGGFRISYAYQNPYMCGSNDSGRVYCYLAMR